MPSLPFILLFAFVFCVGVITGIGAEKQRHPQPCATCTPTSTSGLTVLPKSARLEIVHD